MGNIITESEIEQIALDILRDDLGYEICFGPDIAEGDAAERTHSEVILKGRLQESIHRINGHIPADAREEALKIVLRTNALNDTDSNEAFHRLLTEGVDVKYGIGEGKSKTDKVWLIDFVHPEHNAFCAVNQFTIIEGLNNKRPDIVLFINGLPLVVIELKNSTDEKADVSAAYKQLQTYKKLIPSLFRYNAFMIASDWDFAKAGTISCDMSRFMAWKTADGVNVIDSSIQAELEPMMRGMLNKETVLDIIRHFIVFEQGREQTVKKIAAY